jgi:hypothetical protein
VRQVADRTAARISAAFSNGTSETYRGGAARFYDREIDAPLRAISKRQLTAAQQQPTDERIAAIWVNRKLLAT